MTTRDQLRLVIRAALLAHKRGRQRGHSQLARCVCGWAGPGSQLRAHIADAAAQAVVAALADVLEDEGGKAWTESGDPAPPRS